LSDFLHELLRRRSKVRRIGNDYVFPARTGSVYLIEPKRAVTKVIAASGVKFSMRTLRRTCETIAERLDFPYYALKRLLNHSTAGDVTAGYIIIGVERFREPMQKITNFIKDHAGIDRARQAEEQA
jgi:integrase